MDPAASTEVKKLNPCNNFLRTKISRLFAEKSDRLALQLFLIWYFVIDFLLGNGMPYFAFGSAGIIFPKSLFGRKTPPRTTSNRYPILYHHRLAGGLVALNLYGDLCLVGSAHRLLVDGADVRNGDTSDFSASHRTSTCLVKQKMEERMRNLRQLRRLLKEPVFVEFLRQPGDHPLFVTRSLRVVRGHEISHAVIAQHCLVSIAEVNLVVYLYTYSTPMMD